MEMTHGDTIAGAVAESFSICEAAWESHLKTSHTIRLQIYPGEALFGFSVTCSAAAQPSDFFLCFF